MGSNEVTAGVILRNTAHSMVALWSGMYRRNKAREVWAYHLHKITEIEVPKNRFQDSQKLFSDTCIM